MEVNQEEEEGRRTMMKRRRRKREAGRGPIRGRGRRRWVKGLAVVICREPR